MSRFPASTHLAAWAGVAPGNYESAGKRYSGKTRQGNAALRTTLVQAANAAARTTTYLGRNTAALPEDAVGNGLSLLSPIRFS